MKEIIEILAEKAYKTIRKRQMLKRIKESVDSINQNSNLDIKFSITDGCLEINTNIKPESDK